MFPDHPCMLIKDIFHYTGQLTLESCFFFLNAVRNFSLLPFCYHLDNFRFCIETYAIEHSIIFSTERIRIFQIFSIMSLSPAFILIIKIIIQAVHRIDQIE